MSDNIGTAIEAKRKGISGSTIKMIAIIAMLIDHIGAVVLTRIMLVQGMGELNSGSQEAAVQWLSDHAALYVSYWIMRAIGRLGFPIFCFLLVQGFEHTRNVKKYAFRLFLFALISEFPFDLAFKGKVDFTYQNVFFTLFIGLLTMMAYRWVENHAEWNNVQRIPAYIVIIAAGMSVAGFLKTDYGAIGVACIMVLYIFRKKKVPQIIAGCIAFCWELTAPLAFIPIGFYNGKRGWNIKYFFYIFYPAHLLILYLICCAMGMGNMSVI